MEGEAKQELKVEDRRHFDQDGNPIHSDSMEKEDENKEATPTESGEPEESRRSDLPPIQMDFSSILFTYIHAALVHLGEAEDPETHEARTDLTSARQMIDVLELLQKKTEGNLTKAEARYLENALFDLRMKYVQKAGQS